MEYEEASLLDRYKKLVDFPSETQGTLEHGLVGVDDGPGWFVLNRPEFPTHEDLLDRQAIDRVWSDFRTEPVVIIPRTNPDGTPELIDGHQLHTVMIEREWIHLGMELPPPAGDDCVPDLDWMTRDELEYEQHKRVGESVEEMMDVAWDSGIHPGAPLGFRLVQQDPPLYWLPETGTLREFEMWVHLLEVEHAKSGASSGYGSE